MLEELSKMHSPAEINHNNMPGCALVGNSSSKGIGVGDIRSVHMRVIQRSPDSI
jgi:hypothetical protein